MRSHHTQGRRTPRPAWARMVHASLAVLSALLVGLSAWSSAWSSAGLSAGLSVRPALAAAPQRIVSMNPCVDAILVELVAPARIAAISHYSRDADATSMPLAQARRFTVTYDTAEEVVALRPDLVIASRHTALATRQALARLGVPMLLVGVPQSVADSTAQVRAIARAVGATAAGDALNARIAAAVAAGRTPLPPRPALVRLGSGMVAGRDTLIGELMANAGLPNQSAAYGLQAWDVLPLEALVADPPAVLLSDPDQAGTPAHAVLARLASRIAVRPLPDALLRCGGPTIIAAAAHLAAVRRSLP